MKEYQQTIIKLTKSEVEEAIINYIVENSTLLAERYDFKLYTIVFGAKDNSCSITLEEKIGK